MYSTYFYNQSLLKNLELFEYLFSDVQLQRQNSSNSVQQLQTVSIQYAAGEKYMEQKESDPDLTKSISIDLPRLSYDLVSFRRDPSRQLNPINRLYNPLGPGLADVRYVPVPYDLTFELYLYARNTEDAFKIVEQIVPFFTPYFSIKAELLTGQPSFPININLDQSVKFDQYEGKIADARNLQWILTFTVNSWMWGPDIFNRGDTIRWINISDTTQLGNIMSNTNYYSVGTNTYVYISNTAITNIEPNNNYTVKNERISGYANGSPG